MFPQTVDKTVKEERSKKFDKLLSCGQQPQNRRIKQKGSRAVCVMITDECNPLKRDRGRRVREVRTTFPLILFHFVASSERRRLVQSIESQYAKRVTVRTKAVDCFLSYCNFFLHARHFDSNLNFAWAFNNGLKEWVHSQDCRRNETIILLAVQNSSYGLGNSSANFVMLIIVLKVKCLKFR